VRLTEDTGCSGFASVRVVDRLMHQPKLSLGVASSSDHNVVEVDADVASIVLEFDGHVRWD
jgi:hypothetical protein